MSVLQGLRTICLGFSLCALGSGCGESTLSGTRGPGDAPPGPLEFEAPAAEVCGNGVDDDDNGQVDERCACRLGETQRCFLGDPRLAGVGPCVYGQQRCVGDVEFPAWGTCSGSGSPQAETCGNQLDDDCDGTADEDCACTNGATNPPACDSRTVACAPLPAQAVRNTAPSIAQRWVGGTWLPAATLTHNPTPSTTECRFTCQPSLSWNGSACVATYVARAESRCVNPDNPTNQSAMSWYWFDSNKVRQELKAACQPAPGDAINCSHREGCCTPHGLAINDHCVPYAKQGESCYASIQCVPPLVCSSSQNVCVTPAPSPAASCFQAGGEPYHSGSFAGQRWTHCITAAEEAQGFSIGRVITPGDSDVFWTETRNADRCCSKRLRVFEQSPETCQFGKWVLRCE